MKERWIQRLLNWIDPFFHYITHMHSEEANLWLFLLPQTKSESESEYSKWRQFQLSQSTNWFFSAINPSVKPVSSLASCTTNSITLIRYHFRSILIFVFFTQIARNFLFFFFWLFSWRRKKTICETTKETSFIKYFFNPFQLFIYICNNIASMFV